MALCFRIDHAARQLTTPRPTCLLSSLAGARDAEAHLPVVGGGGLVLNVGDLPQAHGVCPRSRPLLGRLHATVAVGKPPIRK